MVDIDVINSERSDECIDFTMMYVFFVSVYSITSRNNASISNFGGGFRWKSEYPWCIIEVKSKHFPTVFEKIEKNKKKNDGKREFLRKTSFRPNRFFYMVVIQKLISYHCKYLKFSPNVNTTEIFNFYANFVDKIFLALSKYLKILYKVPHMHNFFLLAFEVQILTKIRQKYEYLQIILPLKHKPPFSPTTGNYILG
ncbi:hypothetical protein AGLY_016126 [Aphis glycines]|uniref:Uncharacterized protein n=1 Tax=Aphis glycines TaxID=307491 RepID=A0A6G0T042_APHGL|nr:hypothetical protein AGLY_016126 [Aphis glycines]